MKTLMKYFSLYLAFFWRYLMKAMEYRLNFLIWSFLNLLWLGISFLSITLIFNQTSSIAGWSREQVYLLVLVWTMFFDILATFIRPSLRQVSRLIRRGDLDFTLLRPVSSQFMVSVQNFDTDQLSRLVASPVALVFFLRVNGIIVSPLSLLNFAIISLAAVVIFYSLMLSAVVLNFWLTNLFNLDDLFHQVLSAGHYPLDIFGRNLRAVFTYLIPVAFVSYFQTKALLGQIGFEWAFLAMGLATVLFLLSRVLWRFGLNHYSSASS